MEYYAIRQNNSYGVTTTPAKIVVIEADNLHEAEEKFLKIDGCYFDRDFSLDCPCCGVRWGEFYVYDDRGLEDLIVSEKKWSWKIREDDIPAFYILRKDGKVDIIE